MVPAIARRLDRYERLQAERRRPASAAANRPRHRLPRPRAFLARASLAPIVCLRRNKSERIMVSRLERKIGPAHARRLALPGRRDRREQLCPVSGQPLSNSTPASLEPGSNAAGSLYCGARHWLPSAFALRPPPLHSSWLCLRIRRQRPSVVSTVLTSSAEGCDRVNMLTRSDLQFPFRALYRRSLRRLTQARFALRPCGPPCQQTAILPRAAIKSRSADVALVARVDRDPRHSLRYPALASSCT